jgi:hypothetical protein
VKVGPRRHEQALSDTFTHVLAFCAQSGCCPVGLVALDGTLFAGNASKAANRSYASIREEVEQILGEAAAVDAEEDARFGDRRGDELPPELRDPHSRRAPSSAARRSSSASRPSKTPITSAISPGARPGKLNTDASRQRPTRLHSSARRSTPQTPTPDEARRRPAVAAIPDSGSGEPALLLGAPGATSPLRLSAGSAYAYKTSSMAAGTAATSGSGPGSRTSSNCYTFSKTQPYTFSNVNHLPSCRVTHAGDMERGPRGRFDANLVLKDRGGRANRRQVLKSGIQQVKDSTSRTFAGLRENSLHHWTVYKPATFDSNGNAVTWTTWGTPYDDSSTPGVLEARPQLKVQGRACMTSQSLENAYVMVAFSSTITSGPGNGESGAGQDPATGQYRDIAIRGFISDNALATDVIRRSNHKSKYQDTNTNVINKYDIGCGAALGTGNNLGASASAKPTFDPTGAGPLNAETHPERYQGPSLTCNQFSKYCG